MSLGEALGHLAAVADSQRSAPNIEWVARISKELAFVVASVEFQSVQTCTLPTVLLFLRDTNLTRP
jgi:hypothetical protein